MAVMSLFKLAKGQIKSNPLIKLYGKILVQSTRGAHNRTLEIHPSTYTWYKFKDNMHFYFICAFIPMATFATYENLRYGRSVLTETPENYEPDYWEYERHPVTRWMCWLLDNHQRYDHERKMDLTNHETEKVMLRRIEKQVRAVMKVRGDHKSFYYQPVWQARGDRLRRQLTDKWVEREGNMDNHHVLSYDLEHAQPPNQPASRDHIGKRGGGPAFADDFE